MCTEEDKILCPFCQEYEVDEVPEGVEQIDGTLLCEECDEYTITKE